MVDGAGERGARDGAAAERWIERGGERGVERERVRGGVDRGDGSFPDEVAGAGCPRDAVYGAPAGELAHAEVGDLRGGAGTPDGDARADGKGGGGGDGEAGRADGLAGRGDVGAFAAAGNFD